MPAMEFTLDVDLVRGILVQEHAEASSEIRSLGVFQALTESRQRQDARIGSAEDVGTLACRPGCAWCCHFTVDVRAAEVFSILDYVENQLSAEDQARLHAEISANSQLIRSLDEDERVTRNTRCPFLVGAQCSIYVARPQSCRNYHATDVAGCEKSYAEPDNLDIDPDFAPGVYQAGAAHVEAFSAAMREAGYDTDAYELNCALDMAWNDRDARARFLEGRTPFAQLAGESVVAEFDDLGP